MGKSLRPAKAVASKGKSLRPRIALERTRVVASLGAKHGFKPFRVGLKMQSADTYYVREGDRLVEMVTVMADGLAVAWDMCGSCSNHVRTCTCLSIDPPNAIQTIAYKTAGVVAGQKWENVEEPTKPRDDTPRQIVYPWREKPQGKTLYNGTKPVPKPKSQPPSKGKLLRSATKPKKVEPTIEVDSNFRLSSLDSAAAKSAGDAIAALNKKLFAGRKSLRK